MFPVSKDDDDTKAFGTMFDNSRHTETTKRKLAALQQALLEEAGAIKAMIEQTKKDEEAL